MDAIEYLMEGDPAIRWQVMRDLLDAPESEWQRERDRLTTEGWGSRVLQAQIGVGKWPEGRWIGTLWTLLVLIELGVPPGESGRRGFESVVGRLVPPGCEVSRDLLTTRMDLCHLGFWLRIGGYFLGDDPRLGPLAEIVMSLQMDDGGWNCRIRTKPATRHGSFHTTFNVLEGLREVALRGIVPRSTFESVESRALEFMLQHQMYRSDESGAVIDERFLHMTYPSYWHYNVLRGLDYLGSTPYIRDSRLKDPLGVILGRRKPNGRWPVEKRIPGLTHFDMEPMGGDSRWTTLKALRILRAAQADV